jgi:ubiquitin-conjugating enzyme (huntingtin interacting protein 2)
LDILKDEWSPALTIRTALLSLQILLAAPEPNDPQDAVVASEYKEDRKKFNEHAQDWVKKYASPAINEAKIKRLT